MKSNIKVSVIVPIYNVAPYLPACLDSLCGQDMEDMEIICVDDASTDGSDEILREYARRDERIVPVFHKTNKSTSQARKDGVQKSSGKYIMFVDGDDILLPGACRTAYEAIEKNCTDMVHFGTEVKNCSGVPRERILKNQEAMKPALCRVEAENLIEACWKKRLFGFQLWNKIYNGRLCRYAFEQIRDGEYPKAQDLYAFFLIAYYAHSYIGIEDVLYRYHFGLGVTGRQYMELKQFDTLLTQRKVWEALKDFLEKKGDTEFQDILDGIYRHFLNECIERWLNNLHPEYVSEGFEHLCQAWGEKEVFLRMADSHWYDRSIVAKQMLEVKQLQCRKRDKVRTIAAYYRKIRNGGAQRVVAMLCSLWARMKDEQGNTRYKVVLITDEDTPEEKEELGEVQDYDLDENVIRRYLPSNKLFIREQYGPRYDAWRQILSEEAVDIVVSSMWVDHSDLWDMLCVKMYESRPAYIMHCHNFCCVPYRYEGQAGFEQMNKYRLSDGAVVLSECDEKFIGTFSQNAKKIVNPLTFQAEDTISGCHEKNRILWLGRISQEKQPLDAIYMMEKVLKRVPEAKLYIVGNGDEELEEAIKNQITLRGLDKNIILAGYQEKVEEYYQRASVFISTSQYEGAPMTFYEALAHELPIVTYDMPWLDVIRDGRGICSVEQNRFDHMAEKVADLLQDVPKCRRMGAEGRHQVEEIRQINIADQWREVFENVGKGRTGDKNGTEEVLFEQLTIDQYVGKTAALKRANCDKSELNRKLKQTYSEKSEINRKLQKTYREKSEINRKLQQAYQEKNEINRISKEKTKQIADLKKELDGIKESRSYRLARQIAKLAGRRG